MAAARLGEIHPLRCQQRDRDEMAENDQSQGRDKSLKFIGRLGMNKMAEMIKVKVET